MAHSESNGLVETESWRARRDLNPRFPAPQAYVRTLGSLSVLIRTRLRAPAADCELWLKNCWELGGLRLANRSLQGAGNVFAPHHLNVGSEPRAARRTQEYHVQ